jgi:hypothetical protein
MAKQQYRQGDIFFKETKKSPPAKRTPLANNVIAYGEVTGHSHKIFSPPMEELNSWVDEKGDIYVESPNEPITIHHDEHDVITLPAGKQFCISRQREYDPLAADRERKVKD